MKKSASRASFVRKFLKMQHILQEAAPQREVSHNSFEGLEIRTPYISRERPAELAQRLSLYWMRRLQACDVPVSALGRRRATPSFRARFEPDFRALKGKIREAFGTKP
jgi:hypothetical protein